jgi:hypothetical protein
MNGKPLGRRLLLPESIDYQYFSVSTSGSIFLSRFNGLAGASLLGMRSKPISNPSFPGSVFPAGNDSIVQI